MAMQTYGELRQQIAKEGLKWTVNPKFSDNTPIVPKGLGANLVKFPQARTVARVNVEALVRAKPTTNALLRAHLVGRKLVDESALKTTGSSSAGVAEVGGSGSSGLPTSVDWRNRFTWNFVTSIRDQAQSEHCWIYGPTALVESMVRIEHCVWCDRSEGDFIEANKIPVFQTGDPTDPLSWYANNGVCGQDCVAWVDSDPGDRSGPYWNPPSSAPVPPPAYNPPSNRDGKTVKIPTYTVLGDMTDQKNWIDAIGPLVICMDIYSDFQGWSGPNPYIRSASATYRGGHCMLVVGYDDTKQCWIVKNSWGSDLGEGGFWLIGYGQCNIDNNAKLGFQYSNPDPWTKRRNHGGGMIESGDGALHRNFELVAPSGDAFTHWWRDNSSPSLPWAKAETMGNDVSSFLTFTGTTYNRNFETVYRTKSNRLHHWYFDQATQKWNDGPTFGPAEASGCVGFCESNFGIGNFEVVVAVQGGAMEHWFRAGGTWARSVSFGSGVLTAGPSLLQSTWNNLEFVATLQNGQMQHWWRNGSTWVGDQLFGAGVKSHACMIQGEFGFDTDSGNGNFELCVAMPNGTVQHWWRNNQDPKFSWTMSATFGSSVAYVVALLEGSFGFNLEMIVQRTDGILQHYYRDNGGWHAGVVIGPTA
jgi:Papain family cysteine protease